MSWHSNCDYCYEPFSINHSEIPTIKYGYVLHEKCWVLVHQIMIMGHYFYDDASFYFN